MGKRSLAEKIAELSKPSTEFDIEDNDLRNDVFDHNDDDDHLNSDLSDDETLKKQHYVSLDKSKLRKQSDNLNLGKTYGGKVTNRDDLYESEGSRSFDEEEDLEGSESGISLKSNSESESEEDEDDEDDEDDEADSEDEDEAKREEGSNLTHKRSKLKELMSNERKHIVNRLSQSASNDAVKGYAILQQHKLFDSIIDSRMKVQKSLTNSNVLPIEKGILKERFATKKTDKYLNQAQEKCFDLLDSIIAIRSKLLKKDSVISSSELTKAFNPKKRTLTDYLEVSGKQDTALEKYRSSVLTKWSSKIHNAAGSTAISSGKFKAINQSAEQQVINNLSDMDRLIKRTKLNRRQVKPLGYEYYTNQNEVTEQESIDDQADIPRENKQTNKLDLSELANIFDDEDFYRVLLNDLVDKKIQSSDPASGLTVSLRSVQQAQKFKKNIDTKASKGRKLRYHVQEQIANFEAPRGAWKWDDTQIDEFFASLLGQKVNMNEVDEEDEEHNNEKEEEIINTNDSFKLFG
ncbi:Protein BFR2 [Debaryomyces fabryi]|uniref:Protein BFR2 n=1 Tax=Debaryomyces fabryi TaxID=58627 RepID=A0A0V1PXP8_9ASCO|nr:Protein BFR2 [Debaryomyces fabryi]KSA00914.1 Protein BFR2 [Debaryomyces fabryi]CUM51821.1 unnamed protein product [Debaryomyces fabryi]